VINTALSADNIIELYSATTITKESETKNVQGCSISFKGIDFKAYSTRPSEDSKYNIQSGICVDIEKLLKEKVPVKLKAGNLSYARSVSLLKNPAFSTTQNALKKSFGRSSGLGVTLPSASSSKKEESTAISFLPQNYALEFASLSSDEFLYSAGKTFNYHRFFNYSLNISGGRFYLNEKKFTSWYRQSRSFASDWYDTAVIENHISFPANKIQLSAGIHQSPFGNFRFWIRNENKNILGPFSFETSFFAADRLFIKNLKEGFYEADSSLNSIIYQARINPQYKYIAKNSDLTLSLGLSGMIEKKQKDLLPVKEISEFFAGSAVELSTKKSSASSSFKVSHIPCQKSENTDFEDLKYTVETEFTHTFKTWKANVRSSASVTDAKSGKKTKQIAAVYAYFPKKTLSSVSAGIEKNKSAKTENKNADITATIKIAKKKVLLKGTVKMLFKW